jgi:hypothetical protein
MITLYMPSPGYQKMQNFAVDFKNINLPYSSYSRKKILFTTHYTGGPHVRARIFILEYLF